MARALQNGQTALHIALTKTSEPGMDVIIQLLVDAKADVNAKSGVRRAATRCAGRGVVTQHQLD